MKKLIALLCTLVFSIALLAQTRSVKGKITDDNTGMPVSGVTVQVKGTSTITQTNAAGEFVIQVPSGGTPELRIHRRKVPGLRIHFHHYPNQCRR